MLLLPVGVLDGVVAAAVVVALGQLH